MGIGFSPFTEGQARSVVDLLEVPNVRDHVRQREENIRRYAVEVERDLKHEPSIYRQSPGSSRPVISLTDTALPPFKSVAAAAAFVGRKPYGIIQAIQRKGTCGGHKWDYAPVGCTVERGGPGRGVICHTHIDPDTQKPMERPSVIDMARAMGIHEDSLYKALRGKRTCKGADGRKHIFSYLKPRDGDTAPPATPLA